MSAASRDVRDPDPGVASRHPRGNESDSIATGASSAAIPRTGFALEVDDLVKHFPVRTRVLGGEGSVVRAVDGVSFAVSRGETFAIVGESGCGKSTLARLVLRLIEPTSGRIRLEGEDVLGLSRARLRALRARVQMVFQDPYGSLNPRMTVADMLAEPLALHRVVAAGQRRERVAALLSLVGLRPETAQRYPHEFSGGQRQRIAIARAIAAQPRLVVCDEPVSALDVSIRAQILNLLADLQARLGLTYVFISHDLAVVRHIATRVAVMYLGRFVESGATETLFARPRHPYTRALLAAVPLPVPGLRDRGPVVAGDVPSPIAPPSGCHFHTRCPHAIARCRSEAPKPEPTMEGGVVRCHLWREIADPGSALVPPRVEDPALARLRAAFAVRPGPGPGAV